MGRSWSRFPVNSAVLGIGMITLCFHGVGMSSSRRHSLSSSRNTSLQRGPAWIHSSLMRPDFPGAFPRGRRRRV